MLQRHERELTNLSKEDLSSEDRRQKKAALLNKQQLELNKLEKNLSHEQRGIQQGVLSAWELRYARAKLKLKERHYQEYASALRDISDDANSNQIVSAEQADKAAQELEDVKQKLEKERITNEERLQKEREEFETSEKRRLEEELSNFDKELAAEERKERERNGKRMGALNKRKEEMIKEKKLKQQEKLKQMKKDGMGKAEQERVMDEFERDLAKMSNKMDEDRMRMQADLEARLKKKREEKKNAKKDQIHVQMKENKADMEDKLQSEEEKMRQEEVQVLRECIEIDHLLSDDAPKITYAGYQQSSAINAQFPAGYAAVAPLSDSDLTSLLMASPLYKKLGEIKKTMEGAELPPRMRDQGEPFLDKLDAEWSEDTQLIPTNLSKLNARNFVIYKFGCFIIKLVSANCNHIPVTLLLADKVPANQKLIRNAYRNSYHYDDVNRILYMRMARLDRVGEFVLVLVYALAHIKTGDMRDDSLASFGQEYHNALSVVCNDLFFARYRHHPPSEANKHSSQTEERVNSAAKTLLESISGEGVVNDIEKDESIDQLLDVKLLKVADSDGVHITAKALADRLSKYNDFTVNDQMRDFLGHTEDKILLARHHGSSDEINKRLAALTGNTAPSVQVIGIPSKATVDRLPEELSGTALWQNVMQQSSVRGYTGGRVRLALEKAKDLDLRKCFLQDEVTSLEDKVDNLCADFSNLSGQVVQNQDTISDLRQQLHSQSQLSQDGSKPNLMRDTMSKLGDCQSQLTNLSLKRNTVSKHLDIFRQQLEEKQQELQSYLRRSEKVVNETKKPEAKSSITKSDKNTEKMTTSKKH